MGDETPEDVAGAVVTARIDARTYSVFAERLRQLIEDFDAAEGEHGTVHALNVSLYPHKIDYGPIGKYELKKKQRLRVVK